MEDLWAFNEEIVARAIYDSQIPVISAVGHEPDVTISDFVADLRSATPSNAAELAVPDREALMQNLDEKSGAMAAALQRQLKGARQHLTVLSGSAALQSPTGYLEQKEKQLDYLKNRLISAQNRNLSQKQQRFVQNVAKLDAMSPLKVLTRGYAMAENETGDLIRSVRQVKAGDKLNVRFSDGTVETTVRDTKELTP
jgi:exodeoxyribonuclease VII large subunit